MSTLEDELVGLRAQLERFSLRVSECVVVLGWVAWFIGFSHSLSRACYDGSLCDMVTETGAIRAAIIGNVFDCT